MNSYLGNNQFLNNGYGGFNNQFLNPQFQQRPIQEQAVQYGEVPFVFAKYGTIDEAKGIILAPSRAVLFIDKSKAEFYIKSCDSMGNPRLETFKYSSMNENSTDEIKQEFDPKIFVKQEDLKDFVSKDDLKDFVNQKEMNNYITLDEFKALENKIEQLKKQIDISKMIKGDVKDGK